MALAETKGCQHDTSKKNQLIGAIRSGKTIAQSARLVDMPYSTASDIWKKYRKTGSTRNLPRSGRPSKLTEATKRFIVRTALKTRRAPFREISNQLEGEVCEETVRSVLRERGYHRRVARKVPYLTRSHKQARMSWARMYAKYKKRDWGRVMWSDECYVYLGDDRGRIYVTRRPGEELLEECLVPTFKQSSVRVMVWGCIMRGRKGPLVVLEYPGGKGGGMNSTRYREQVLDGVVKDFYAQVNTPRQRVLFQQDGAPSHTSKMTKRWFEQNHIPLLFHPASSPDLSPIEPVWHELKRALRALPHPPNTVEQLQAAVQSAWDELPIEDVDKHVNRMEDRVHAIFAAKGGHTRF